MFMPREIPHPLPSDCQGELHPMALRGFQLFNAGEYWRAHEALESAWLEEPGQIRHLYRGILQAGVVFFHIQKLNYAGADKVYRRSLRWLNPFPDVCRGIAVQDLRQGLAEVMAEIYHLGAQRMQEFDQSRLCKLHRADGSQW